MRALVNCDIYTGKSVRFNHALLVDGSRIVGIVEPTNIPADSRIVDMGGLCVAPGFIDLQVNGAGGVLFNDTPSIVSLERMSNAMLSFGTTGWLPTIITDTYNTMSAAAMAVSDAIGNGRHGVLGIHFEGPFLASSKAGVHNPALMRGIDEPDWELFGRVPANCARLVTVAPECIKASEISKFAADGWKVSLGHSNASADQVLEAFDAGARGVTHVHNAMSAMGSRQPGMVGAAMADDRAWGGIITDGFHVDFVTVRATYNAWQAHKRSKLFLVTDAMPPVGADIASFHVGEYEIFVKNGKCETADGVLGGSCLDMASAVRNCVQKVGIAKDEALRMASTYPAEFMGIDDRVGLLEQGRNADIVVFDNEIKIRATIRHGQLVYGDLADY